MKMHRKMQHHPQACGTQVLIPFLV